MNLLFLFEVISIKIFVSFNFLSSLDCTNVRYTVLTLYYFIQDLKIGRG